MPMLNQYRSSSEINSVFSCIADSTQAKGLKPIDTESYPAKEEAHNIALSSIEVPYNLIYSGSVPTHEAVIMQ